MSVTTIYKADSTLEIFGYIIGIIAEFFPTKHNTYTTHHLFPLVIFSHCSFSELPAYGPDVQLFLHAHFKSCSKRKAERGERNIWLHSTGDQFHKFWRLQNTEKGSLAGSAEGECWQHTKQHDPNDLENPWPSRGLSRCYCHEKRYCFTKFRLPSLTLSGVTFIKKPH